MGKVINVTTERDKIVLKLEITSKEYSYLKGELEEVNIFADRNLEIETRLVKRGKHDSTKYFLVPKAFKEDLKKSNSIMCNRIEKKTKTLYIFDVEKY
jgi:hypothetical protein